MTERKPASESFESFAERKIREAQEEGVFDSLPGFGRPIPDLDAPDDENWWLKNKLRQENLVALPPILEARLDAEKTLATVWSLGTEQQVKRTLQQLNQRIRQAHFSPLPGPAEGVAEINVESIVDEWRRRRLPETTSFQNGLR